MNEENNIKTRIVEAVGSTALLGDIVAILIWATYCAFICYMAAKSF